MTTRTALVAVLALTACNGGEEADPALDVSVEGLDFGPVPLGTEATESVVVSNTGGGEVEILSVTLVDGDPQIFDVRRPAITVLGAGESVEIGIVFSPDREKTEAGRVQIRTSLDAVFVRLDGEGAASTLDNDGDGQSSSEGDCNDDDPDVYDGATEVCDGKDNNCDGTTPANEADADSDGYRLCDDDCDDSVGTIYPGAPEICDQADSDCDGATPDNLDSDGDGATLCDGDCDDSAASVGPDKVEVCANNIDDDCSGVADDVDADGDGHSLCTEAGDCDDGDASVYPLIVDAAAASGGDGTEATPYQTIAAALPNVVDGCEVIWVTGGNYSDAIVVNANVQIFGEVDSSGAPLVTWTPTAGSHAIETTGDPTLLLRDLRFTGASFPGDGGALSFDGGAIVLDTVILESNTATGDGGAIALSGGNLIVTNSVLRQNTADDDGGAISALSSTLHIVNSRVSSNTAKNGGGVFASSVNLTVTGTRLAGNDATGAGAGIYQAGGSSELLRNDIQLNTATTRGGGLSLTDVASGTTEIRNNTFQDNDGGAAGGGISVSGTSDVLFANNTLTGNTADDGGAVSVTGSSTDVDVQANVAQSTHAETGNAAFAISANNGGTSSHNTSFQCSSGVHFSGSAELDDGGNDTQNLVIAPGLKSLQDNGNPADDDLTLASGASAIDSGPADSSWDDLDGSQNDRGYTGGPQASP